MSANVILATEAVSKRFGGFTALKDVSIEFRAGELTSIIGPNGAGKSTYFNLLTGALRPSQGRVLLEGRDISGLRQHEFARLGIAKSFQITNIFRGLSVLENVRVAVQATASRYDCWSSRHAIGQWADRARELLDMVGLADQAAASADSLAHGQQRALELAMALASEPRILLLDEPTAGMSPTETVSMMDLIVRLAQGRTLVLVEHKMKLVMGISQRLIVLHHGELLAEGSPADIRANEEVRRVYLGQKV